jgi:hypothetical protein
MGNAGKNLAILSVRREALVVVNTTAIAINGLAGFVLATDKALGPVVASGLIAGDRLAGVIWHCPPPPQ